MRLVNTPFHTKDVHIPLHPWQGLTFTHLLRWVCSQQKVLLGLTLIPRIGWEEGYELSHAICFCKKMKAILSNHRISMPKPEMLRALFYSVIFMRNLPRRGNQRNRRRRRWGEWVSSRRCVWPLPSLLVHRLKMHVKMKEKNERIGVDGQKWSQHNRSVCAYNQWRKGKEREVWSTSL